MLVVLLGSCASVSTEPAFFEKTGTHRIIAILPFEMVFTGHKPKKLTYEQVQKIEEIESISFQRSFYDLLMEESSSYSRHPVRIDIQPIQVTNRILDENQISIRDSWQMETVELARVLDVDAVVRTQVEKRRYMSDGTSLGIEIGTGILSALLDDSSFFSITLPTNDIKARSFIFNGRDGALLWTVKVTDQTDWHMPANAIIENINRYFAAKFPYR
jgi:hypothetical protein